MCAMCVAPRVKMSVWRVVSIWVYVWHATGYPTFLVTYCGVATREQGPSAQGLSFVRAADVMMAARLKKTVRLIACSWKKMVVLTPTMVSRKMMRRGTGDASFWVLLRYRRARPKLCQWCGGVEVE
jgi:hypothetical protein